jgi:transcriptional regulator with XRE-family HTH domain
MDKPDRGSRLRDKRKSSGLTQNDLAKRAKLSITYVSELENGKKEGKLGVWRSLADALLVDFVSLYAGAPELKTPEAIPLVGAVSGDPDTNFAWDIDDSIVATESVSLPKVRALRVKGNSMDPVARDGQYVLFTEDWPHDGDLCVCCVSDRKFFKRYYCPPGSGPLVTLQSVAGHRPLLVKRSEIAWARRVVGVVFV